MHDCPSRDLDRLHHPIDPLVTTGTPKRRPDAHRGPSVLESHALECMSPARSRAATRQRAARGGLRAHKARR